MPALAAGNTSSTSTKQLEQHYAALYDALLELGFSAQQVQYALAAMHGAHMAAGAAQQQTLPWMPPQQLSTHAVAAEQASMEACLDWLCLHVPAAQLPRRFTGSAAAQVAAGSEGVKVRG